MRNIRAETMDLNTQGQPFWIELASTEFRYVTMQGSSEDGSWTTANLELEVSNDGRNWYSHPGGAVQLTGPGITTKTDIAAFAWVRAYVETVQGGSSQAAITFVFTDQGA